MKKLRDYRYWQARIMQGLIIACYSWVVYLVMNTETLNLFSKHGQSKSWWAICIAMTVMCIVVVCMEEWDIRTHARKGKEFNKRQAEEAEQMRYFVEHMESLRVHVCQPRRS